MKIKLITLMCFICVMALSQSGIDGYVLLFHDDFDGNSLREDTYFHDQHSIGATRNACLDLETDNYQVSNSQLALKAWYTPNKTCNETWWDDDTEVTRDWSYQNIRTIRNYRYGKFKTRVYLEQGSGLFPAYWMFGGYDDDGIGNFNNTEIDVFEIWTTEGRTQGQLRMWSGSTTTDFKESWGFTPYAWKTYELTWTEEEMIFSENNTIKHKVSMEVHPQLPPLKPGNVDVLLGNQLWDGAGPLNHTETFYMYVDYLTIKYPIDTDEIIHLDNYYTYTTPEESAEINTAFAGKEIIVSENHPVVVHGADNQWDEFIYLDLIATDRIVLKPGFHAEKNSKFRAWIVSETSAGNFKSTRGTNVASDENEMNRYKVYPADKPIDEGNDFDHSDPISGKILDSSGEVNQLLVYPNPVSEVLTIKLPNNADIETLHLYDLSGVLIKTITDIQTSSINLDGLVPGNYQLEIIGKNNIYREIISKK